MNPGTEPLEAQRLEALAQIARGITPAFSDLLTVIRGQAGRLVDQADHAEGAQEPLRQIYSAAERAGSLLRELQIFSGQLAAHPEVTELNAFMAENAGLLRRLLGERIAVELRLAPDLPLIVADRGLLEQWLIILALNAGDAMPGGGRLLVETGVVDIARATGPAESGAQPGKFVALKLTDTGTGIAPEILARIFEPFFTTKNGSRHTGLGLAAAFGIVKQHHGWMTAESAVKAGASFTAFLPLAPADAVPASDRGAAANDRRGNETILFVEDEAAVREFVAAFLAEQGYRVLQAASGPEALEVWKWHGQRVRLLLTDMVLEDGMTGLELAATLRAENPALKVICMSGLTRETMRGLNQLPGGCQFLQKPCRPQTLLAAVRTLLDANPH